MRRRVGLNYALNDNECIWGYTYRITNNEIKKRRGKTWQIKC